MRGGAGRGQGAAAKVWAARAACLPARLAMAALPALSRCPDHLLAAPACPAATLTSQASSGTWYRTTCYRSWRSLPWNSRRAPFFGGGGGCQWHGLPGRVGGRAVAGQLICAVPRRRPPIQASLDAEAIRNEKVKVLQTMAPVRLEDCVLGQYRSRTGAHRRCCRALHSHPARPLSCIARVM